MDNPLPISRPSKYLRNEWLNTYCFLLDTAANNYNCEHIVYHLAETF